MKFTVFLKYFVITSSMVFSLCAHAQSNINFGPPTGQPAGGGEFGRSSGQRVNGIYFGPPAGRIEAVRVNGSTDSYSRMGNGSLYNSRSGEVLSPVYMNGQLVSYSGTQGTRFVRRNDGAFGSSSGLTIPRRDSAASSIHDHDSEQNFRPQSVMTPSQRVYSQVAAPIQAGVETVGRLAPNTIYTVIKTYGPWVSLRDSHHAILPGWVLERYLRVYR